MQAEHAGTRTYYFGAESHQEQEEWIQVMSGAAQFNPQRKTSENAAPAPEANHTMVTKAPDTHTQQHPPTQTHGHSNEADSDQPPQPEVNGVDTAETPSPSTPIAPNAPNANQEVRMSEERRSGGERGGGGGGAERDRVGPGPASGHAPHPNQQPNGWGPCGPPHDGPLPPPHHGGNPPPPRAHSNGRPPPGHPDGGGGGPPPRGARDQPPPPPENVVLMRGFVPRTAPERLAQRKSSMTQLQQWVNQRRVIPPQEDMNSPSRYYTVNRGVSADFYSVYPGGPQYVDEYPLYPPGVRPDSICSVSAVGGYDRRRSLRDGPPSHYGPPMPRDPWGPPQQYYGGPTAADVAQNSMRRLSIQPRSRSVPRSPSSSSGGPYSPGPHSFVSPARSPSTRFDRLPGRMREDVIYADPSIYGMRRSISSPKYDYPGDRRSLSQGLYHYPASPSIHSKMVPPFHDVYSRELHPTLKLNEIETSKILGRLCEQNRIVKDQEAVVHRLRMDKDSLEGALVATHQEMEMYHNQPLAMDKLQLKKETLQNQLINIRGELSQASSALTTSRMEFEALEDEANAIHGDLWEQLNAGGQSELVHRHIQKEFWRVQDVLEGLHKSNSSRGTDTAKHRVVGGPQGSFSTNSPASPLSSVSLTSPLSPYSPMPATQPSPTKQLGPEHKYGERPNANEVQEQEQERLSNMNKVGIVPPRTKSPTDEPDCTFDGVTRRNGKMPNGISRERPKSAVFPAEVKSKMSVEEQNERIRRNQSSSVRDKRRSLNLSTNYKVVRRRLTAHEVDIKDLEAAVRGEGVESPRQEIARLRRLQIEPENYAMDINKELMAPEKVLIPERYLDVDVDTTPLSPEEQKEKQKKVERIKTLIAKSNLQNVVPLLDGPSEGSGGGVPVNCEQQLQEQEKRIEISCALAAEASRRSRLLSAQCAPSPPTSPTSLAPPPSSADFPDSAHIMKV